MRESELLGARESELLGEGPIDYKLLEGESAPGKKCSRLYEAT